MGAKKKKKKLTVCLRLVGALNPLGLAQNLGKDHAQKRPCKDRTGGDKDLRAPKMGFKGCPSGVCACTHTQKTTISHLNIIINKLTACKAHPNWVAQEERGKKRSQKQNNRNNPFRC